MFAAMNAWTLPDATPRELIATAAEAGFAGVELSVSDQGPLTFDASAGECRDLAAAAKDHGIQLVGLATLEFWRVNYGSPEAADRQRARDLTLRLLDLAAALDAGAILVVPAVVGRWGEARPGVAYADALARTGDALGTLRYEAEARDVLIAVKNVWNHFLLSPVEAADLIDRVNSPHVGFHFDTGNVMAFGHPRDWIDTLGGRIVRVHAKDYDLARPGPDGFCPLGEGSVPWPEVVAALRRAGYDGPLTFEGPGDPADIHRRLALILDGRSPRDGGDT